MLTAETTVQLHQLFLLTNLHWICSFILLPLILFPLCLFFCQLQGHKITSGTRFNFVICVTRVSFE
jgi:hypothetical protein